MSHSKADVIQSRTDLANAIQREIGIHKGYIAALENAMRGLQMVTASEIELRREPLPLHEDDIPVAKGFIKNLSEKIAAAGNGQ